MRSMVAGRREAPLLFFRKIRSLRSRPSTALRAVPLPRLRGGGCRHKHPHPRGAFFCSHRSLATPLHESCPEKKRRGRSADRRIRITNRATPTDVTACRCSGRGARHAVATLPPQRASGALASRRSVAALARFLGLAQLRAALTGICRSLRRFKPLLLASSSRPDRSVGEAGSEAARERFARPRAGTALAPPSGSHPECALGERVAALEPCHRIAVKFFARHAPDH